MTDAIEALASSIIGLPFGSAFIPRRIFGGLT